VYITCLYYIERFISDGGRRESRAEWSPLRCCDLRPERGLLGLACGGFGARGHVASGRISLAPVLDTRLPSDDAKRPDRVDELYGGFHRGLQNE